VLDVRMADRPEDLLDELVAGLSEPSADPFAKDWVSVPSLGFRSWLQLRLADRLGGTGRADGVVANVDLPFPGSLRWALLRAHRIHEGRADETDPWQVDRLVWSILHVLSDSPPGLDPRLTRANLPPGVALASRAAPIADLLDRYSVHRPEMLTRWVAGEDVGPSGMPLASDRAWQPLLFRAVRSHIAARHGGIDMPSVRLAEALALVRTGELALDDPSGVLLPRRLFVFGLSILPSDMGPLLQALAAHRQVSAMLLSPSARVAARLASPSADGRAAPDATTWAFARPSPSTPVEVGHPLLASWAERPFDTPRLLRRGGVVPQIVASSSAPTGTLLGLVQDQLQAGEVEPASWALPEGDGSVQIHRAPGPTRQVEVLRDVVLGLLRDHPDLRESDIAIVCPQLDAYAPVLGAVFGPSAQRGQQPEAGCTPSLRYTVVDRSARSFNPVLDAMATLLEVLPGRFDVASVRELLSAPAVQRCFGFQPGDLALFSQWVSKACVRWGLDGPHRDRWGIAPDHRANSWAAGVDALMMGVALGDDLRDVPLPGTGTSAPPTAHHALAVGGILPVALAEGDLGAAGRLAAALRSMAHVHGLLQGAESRPVTAWVDDLRDAADLLVAAEPFEPWQRTRLDEVLGALPAASVDADGDPSETPITFGDLRRLLGPALEGASARADLGFGSMVIARPSLLAGVPFRVVCILGLDEDALPGGAASGDDLSYLEPFVGDRETRSEARAELLAALGSARDHLIVTCTSTDVRTSEPVPESVLLDELVEVLAATIGVTAEQLRDGTGGLVRAHPRQSFAPSNFAAEGPRPPFGFDPAALAGARALTGRTASAAASGGLLAAPLAPSGDPLRPVELADLHRFYAHPVQAFFRNRLNVTIPRSAEAADEQLPISLGGLGQAAVGAELLAAGMALPSLGDVWSVDDLADAPVAVRQVVEGFRARGFLPPDSVAVPKLGEILTEVGALLAVADTYEVRGVAVTAHPIDVHLPDGTRIVGGVNGCIDGPCPGPVRISYHRPRPRTELALVLDLLVLTAARPEVRWRAVAVARGVKADADPVAWVKEVRGDSSAERAGVAMDALVTLLGQFRDGQRFPLPLFEKTSYELYAGGKPKDAWGPAGDFGGPKEADDPYHVLAFGEPTYPELVATEFGGHRVATEAERLWSTLAGATVELDEPDEEEDDA
jgi:exodeoxyribonuclease V gamma subunit